MELRRALGGNTPGRIAKAAAFLLDADAFFIIGALMVADAGCAGLDYFIKKENDSLGEP